MFATLRNASVMGIIKPTQDVAHAPGTGLLRGNTRRRQATKYDTEAYTDIEEAQKGMLDMATELKS